MYNTSVVHHKPSITLSQVSIVIDFTNITVSDETEVQLGPRYEGQLNPHGGAYPP